jgi:site-specific recombinase XerD
MSKGVVKTLQELVQTFFCQRLQIQQRVSGHTVASYRDTFRLAFEFIQKRTGRAANQQSLADWEAPTILAFLDYLEKERGCEPRTRNARLAAIRAFMRYVSQQEPTALALSSRVLAIPMKRFDRPLAGFLTKPELDAILNANDPGTTSGRRDRLFFNLLYHTGARVSEMLAVHRQDIQWGPIATVQLKGKGRKQRPVPLLKPIAADLKRYINELPVEPTTPLFTNRFGQQLSRSGVEMRLHLAMKTAVNQCPSLRGKRVSPHTFRHTTAMHLLEAGIDITVIALMLGHESPTTTHHYVELNMQMKERCLQKLQPTKSKIAPYKPSDRVLAFLDSL